MPNYEYIALDAKGEQVTGLIDAESEADAVGQLRRTGYYPTKVSAPASPIDLLPALTVYLWKVPARPECQSQK